MSVRERLTEAVRGRRVVRFRYAGAAGRRTCHPHVLFEDSAGHLLLDAVQTAGPSESGASTSWRTFDLAYVREVAVLDGGFEPDPGMNLASPKYHRIRVHC
jgi:hypothetical protein